MKSVLISILLSLLIIWFPFSGFTSEDNDLDWLVGHWHGKAFGGSGEEVWLPMSAGTMVGTYKQKMNGKVKFYEFMIIEKTDIGYSLKLKHFTPEMIGWEEKDKYEEFPFVKSGDNYLEFDGLTFHLKDNGKLEIKVKLEQKDGSIESITTQLTKIYEMKRY